jgi:hypothetical protein
MKQFNNLREIADALEAGEITKNQAIEIAGAGLKRPIVVIVDKDRKPSGTPETVVKNLRSYAEKLEKGESAPLIINLSN